MARKAIKGYPEKSYYDNTSFKGVHATLNPLNEGYFNQMINFDIDDTGQSVKPRRGFLTTTLQLKDNENTVDLPKDSTLYFFDPDISKYIFINFSTFKYESEAGVYSYSIEAYKASFTLGPNRQFNVVEKITNVDLDDIIRLFSPESEEDWITLKDAITKLKFYKQPESLTASDLITRYIFKIEPLSETINYTFLECFYRKSGSTFNDVTFESDTLVITYPNTEDTISIDQSQRNIASFKSIIPNPMQKIYETDPDDLPYNRFDFIYAQENTSEKYLINYAKDINVTLTPHYLLKPTDTNYEWAYSYDIISTNPHAKENTVYHAPIYTLKDNVLYKAVADRDRLVYYKTFFETAADAQTDKSINTNIHAVDSSQYLKDLKTFYSEITWDHTHKYFNSQYFTNAALIYVVPTPYGSTVEYNKSGIYIRDFLQFLDERTSWYDDPKDNPFNETLTKLKTVLESNINVSTATLFSSLNELNLDYARIGFYIVPIKDIQYNFEVNTSGVQYTNLSLSKMKQYAFTSPIMIFNSAPLTYTQLKEHVQQSNYTGYIFKSYDTSTPALLTPQLLDGIIRNDSRAFQVFENIQIDDIVDGESQNKYYNVCIDTSQYHYYNPENTLKEIRSFKGYFYVHHHAGSGGESTGGGGEGDVYNYTCIPTFGDSTSSAGTLVYSLPFAHVNIINEDVNNPIDVSLFTKPNDILQLVLSSNSTHPVYKKLNENYYFDQGITIMMYLIKIPTWEFYKASDYKYDVYDRTYLINTTNLIQSRPLIIGGQKPSYMTEYLTEEPNTIKSSTNFLVFNSELGVHLVTWYRNKVYVSEADTYYYFKSTGVYTVPETVLKVIQFKNTLLVFTTQNLYSIYPYTDTEIQSNGLDEEGNEQFVQVEVIRFGILPVLYNLMVSTQYLDAIQVFNQMVLFYSADGQLYLIKPTATIDSDTKFSIQYFNKAANDILLNYDKYMQERLKVYNLPDNIIKNDVKIKVQVNINYIKIFYTYKNYMYILIYDVINNYYFIYDTCNFSDIQNILFIGTGDLYISTQTVNSLDHLVFTTYADHPISMNNNYDENIYLNFVDTPIQLELDTGTLNLNTHLKKRFRDLRVIYKNISASDLQYSLDIFIDDILTDAYLEDQIVVNSSEGQYVYDVATTDNTEDVLSEAFILFNLSDFTSNKIITHYTNISCLGKFFRARFRFSTKGSFKFLGYGLVFKEHQI